MGKSKDCLIKRVTGSHLFMVRLPDGELVCAECGKRSGSREIRLPKVKGT